MYFKYCVWLGGGFHFPEKFPPQNYVLCPPRTKIGGWRGNHETHGPMTDRPALPALNPWSWERLGLATKYLHTGARCSRFSGGVARVFPEKIGKIFPKKSKGYIFMWTLSEISETCIMLVVSIFDVCLILFDSKVWGRCCVLLQVVASVFLAAYLLLQLSAADTRPRRLD